MNIEGMLIEEIESALAAKDTEIAELKARLDRVEGALRVLADVSYAFKSWDEYGRSILEIRWLNEDAANPADFARRALSGE